ncbi:MAG: hypothetical protein CFE46_16630 [Burkholderiales bacterium PBB6]|nr:MAG: hypothetical protein CFE46_16630 [Burkholderiales bacterium PBB6]
MMLGMVFTELMEMVEERFSPEVADAILQKAAPEHGGAYTAVGYYGHGEIVALVVALSELTGVPVPDLVQAFGEHLLGRFTQLYPQMFTQHSQLFDFLASIEPYIHVEVRKLYSNAQLPTFEVLSRNASQMHLLYSSPRKMESLALGLLLGAARHFGQPVQVRSEPGQGSDGQAGTVFIIDLQAA